MFLINQGPFTASDLPINPETGRIYHLDIKPEELAPDILIVGDPGRAAFIAKECFGEKEVDRDHRGLRTVTGIVEETGQRVSVVTSGMGTPSLEIILNELVALNEIDFETMERKERYNRINIIRVGTSGGLQESTELGIPIITDYAVGFDNSGLFLNFPYNDPDCEPLENAVREAIDERIDPNSRFKGKIFPYATRADWQVTRALREAAAELGVDCKLGITASNSGFFAHQGRDVARVSLTVPDIDGILAELDSGIHDLRFENMEMESSFLLPFMTAHSYRAGAICPAIANRRSNKFAHDYGTHVRDATRVALNALYALRYRT